jgi:hypothetical protein
VLVVYTAVAVSPEPEASAAVPRSVVPS